MKQKVRTVLIPEIGLSLEPEFLKEYDVDGNFTRALAHLVGQTGSRSIMIRATSDGRLHVASAGVSFEWYEVEAGNAPDAWAAPQTFEYAAAVLVTDISIETFEAEISFINAAGVWGDAKRIPVGISSIDFVNYGVRIRNRVALSVAAFELTFYR